jgi:hypothetical protein
MQSKAAAWTERWKLLACLARLKEPQVLSCGISGGTLSLPGLHLPFISFYLTPMASERGKERRKEIWRGGEGG